jgi:FkbM family methyltransferase
MGYDRGTIHAVPVVRFIVSNLLYTIYGCFNGLYKHCYTLYKPVYFLYKYISDREKIAFIRKAVRPGMIVLDVGANIGFYTLLFSKLVGKEGHVIAFEPDALNFSHLMANTRKVANVTVCQMACAEKSQILKLYLSDTFNVDHQTFDSGEGRTFVETTSVSIDDYLGDSNHTKVDFIKIDVQGYDFQVIKGATRTIEDAPSLVILGELWPYALHRAGARPDEYLSLLERLGFSLTFPEAVGQENFDAKVHDRYFYTDFVAEKGIARDR